MCFIRGEVVLLERRRAEFTQEVLARRVGINRSYISKLEKNQNVNIGIKHLFALADELKLSVADLINWGKDSRWDVDKEVEIARQDDRKSASVIIDNVLRQGGDQAQAEILELLEAAQSAMERQFLLASIRQRRRDRESVKESS